MLGTYFGLLLFLKLNYHSGLNIYNLSHIEIFSCNFWKKLLKNGMYILILII